MLDVATWDLWCWVAASAFVLDLAGIVAAAAVLAVMEIKAPTPSEKAVK